MRKPSLRSTWRLCILVAAVAVFGGLATADKPAMPRPAPAPMPTPAAKTVPRRGAKPARAKSPALPAPQPQQAPAQQLQAIVPIPAYQRAPKDPNLPRLRADWFQSQRAYPFDHIPADAFQKAIAQRDLLYQQQHSGKPFGAAGLVTFPGDGLWHPLGPQPTNNPFGQNGGFPTASGRATAMAVDTTDATGNTVYLGGAAGGVWKTTDGGAHWTALTDTQPSMAVGSIAIDPNNHLTIYVGTGEENFSGDAYYGAGILKSTDGGTTWTQLGASVFAGPFSSTVGGAKIGAIAVQPGNSSIVLAAVTYADGGTMGGIFRSTDAGTTWTQVSAGTPPIGASGTAVVFEPTVVAGTTAIAYAAMGDPFGDTHNGIYKSTDSGVTWTKLTTGLPGSNVGRIQLGYAPNTSGGSAQIYAAIADSSNSSQLLQGFFVTTNGGTSWTQLSNTPDFCKEGSGGGGQCYYDLAIGVHPTNANFVVVGGAAYSDNSTTLFKSTDGGNTWSTDSTSQSTDFTLGSTNVRPHVDTHVVMFAPTGGTPILYTGDDGGVWKTIDPTPGNPLWVDLNATLALSQFYPGAMSSVSDENYGFGGTQDNDIQTFSGTLDWTETGICGDGGGIAVDSTTPTTIYGACNLGSPFKVIKSVLYGMNLSGPVQSFAPAETAITASGDRMQFIPPLTMDPENPNNLYFGTCRVWQTTNATGSWAAISGDLTSTNLPGMCGAGSNNITTLGVSAKTSANVLVGTTNGKVWQTTTLGALWSEIDNGLLPNRHVTAVRYKPTDSTGQIVYVTVSGFQSGHVFKTTNGGTSWTDISGNLPDTPVNDIIVDHNGSPFDALYIATDVGVFSCPDPESGTPCTNWTVIGDPLPNSPVLAISMRQFTRELHAYTHGRGAFYTQLRDQQIPSQPLLSSLTPAAVMAYSPTTNVAIQGANFSANTLALLNGVGAVAGITTTVLSTTQLTMSIPSTLLTTGVVYQVSLSDPLGNAQNTLPFTVMNPIPVITIVNNIVPGTGVVGEPVTFTLGGTGFVSGTQMTFSGIVVASGGTANSTGTQLVITVPGTALTAPLAPTVSLSNPLPGGGPSTTGFTGFTIVANAGPEATFTPSAIIFSPGQNPGTTSPVTNVQLSNTGGATLNLSSASIVGPNQSAFALVAPTSGSPACNFATSTITVGNSCFFGMTFSPAALATPGAETATLQVSDNDSNGGDPSPQNVPISGTVNGPVPLLFPNPLNFGSVPKGTPSMVGNETLFNIGSGAPALAVASISVLVSANSGDFVIGGPNSGNPACNPLTGGFNLSSFSLCDFGITFTPSQLGLENATLRVTFSNSATASIDVPLSGTGVAPVITSISPAGVATGGPPFTLTVNGVDFILGATVNFNGTALLTTFVSSTQLLASVPASDIVAAGSFAITATNPSGGGTSQPKTLVVAAAPTGTNDDFNNAIDASATPYRITEDTTLMTTNTGGRLDPAPACAPGGASLSGKAKSAWFKFVATATGKIVADTRFSGYAAILSVWTGAPGAFSAVTNGCASGNVASSPAESLVGFNVTSGTTYFLMVTDVAGVGGTLTFSLDFASAAPANDNWANAITATPSLFTSTVNTILATTDTGGNLDPTPACAPGGAASSGKSNSVWYKFVPASSGTVTADTLTSPYDTILSVWTGAPGSFVAVASGCNDNAAAGIAQSQVSFSVASGTTYYLIVTAVLGDGGTTNFHLNFAAGAPATTVKVETKPDGTGTLVPPQNVPAGTSVTGYAISRDAGGNFVANVAATWSLVSTTGGVLGGDLVPAGDTKSATFTGHLVGTAAMHAVVGGLTSTDSGTLTVVAGAATVVNVETAANGGGTVLAAQNVSAGSSVTGFAISRDAGGNFVANVAGTWSLTNVTGGVVQGDLVAAGGGLSATFTGHLLGTATIHVTSGALTAGNSGTLTVIAGAATVVNVETAANGTGTVVGAQNVPAGSSVTGYAISRDAGGNFIANVAGGWSLTNVTGGVVQGDLVAAGGGLNATFTGHLVGTATIHVTSGALTAGNSGTLTVIAGAATIVNVETAANGTGTVVGAQNVPAGSSVTGFAISRDAGGNFVANVAGVWSLTNVTGGVVQGDLVAAGGGLNATFTGHLVGTATIHVTSGALTAGNSGTLTVIPAGANVVNVETAANGSGTVVGAQNVSAGSGVTGYAISRDALGNFVANVVGTWSLTNVTGGVVQGDLVAAGGGLNATFTGHLVGTATIHVTSGALTAGNSGTLTVVASAATVVNVETAANGSGTVLAAQNVSAGSSVTGFAIGRDAGGNFVANVAGTWSLTNVTGGVVQGDLVAAGSGLSATFTGHATGTATVHVTSGALTPGNSGTLTVIATVATVVNVETAANGTGTVLTAQNIPAGSSITGYAISRDAGGNFIANVAGVWSLTNVTGGVVQGDLVAAGGGLSATFTGHLLGTATIHVTSGALTAGNSGTLTVIAGAATVVNVETAANGTGTVVGAQNVPAGSSVTGYAISRDAGGNFIANVAGGWSLTNVTGGVVQGDLVAAGGGLNATFTGHLVGTATIHVTSGALTAGNSGTLTVIAGAATIVNVETAANGTGTVVGAQNVPAGSSVTGFAISRDAGGNFVANVAGVWSLTNVTGGVVQGDLVAAGGGLNATFTGHLVGTATIHVTSGALTAGNSGTLTVIPAGANVVNVETAANGSGTVVGAQNVSAGSGVTGYAISRDALGNFVANVVGTWSLTNVTGGVVQGDLVAAGGGLNATFTGHLVGTATIHVTSGALTAGNSGTLTVVASAATVVNVETAANGSGTVLSAQNVPEGSSATGYAISRDAGGNFVANVAGVWSLTNVTGGVLQGDLVAAGGGLNATFTGHLVGTATIHVTSGALTAGNSGTLTVIPGAATAVIVETAANGTGTVVGAQNVPAGSGVTGYAISRDALGNFVANVAGVWSLTNVTGGVVQGDLVAAGGGLNATFTGHAVGTATVHVTSGALTAGTSGTLTVIANVATVVNVETAANGTGAIVGAQNVPAGSSVTGYAISRDAGGNFIANVAAAWSLTNVTGGVVQGDLVAVGGGLSATFTGHLVGTATIRVTSGALTPGNSGTLTVVATAATAVNVETVANGTGTVVGTQNVPAGSSVTGYAISRDASGNFVANVVGVWSLTNVTGGVVQGDLVAAGGGLSAAFTGHLLGTATIHVTSGALTAGNSGTLTVVAGAATVVNVETAANGSGAIVGAQNVPASSSLTGYAISRDAGGNFVANVAGTWSLTNVTGGVVQGDLVAAGGGLSATFTGHLVGTATIHVTSGALTAGNSGTLTVAAGAAAVVNVETAANGSGTAVGAQNVPAGSSVTGFAISRDAGGNFIANVAGVWSLTNVTGGVVQGDLLAAGGGLSATLTGHLVGTATIHVTSGALTAGNSGTLTVVAGAATAVKVETTANGSGTVVGAQNVPAGSGVTGYAVSRDALGNFVANVAGVWSLTSVTGGVLQGDLVAAGGGLNATFTGHLVGTATIHVTSGALTAGNSGTLTVVASAATVVNAETAATGTGTVVGAQNVTAGSSVTGYAISRDAGGNFIANVAGTWALTNVTGGVVQGDLLAAGGGLNATFTGHLVGTATIHVTSGVLTASNSGTLTVVAGTAASITATAGTPQSATASNAFATALAATVKDASGNLVPNVQVTFMAPAQAGASGTFAGGVNTATTNANGVATAAAFTANATGGSYVVNATVSGVAAPAPFALTNVDFTLSLVTPGTVQITAGTPSNIPLNLNTTPAGLPLPAAVNYTCTVPAMNTGGMPLTGMTCAVMPASTPAGTVGGSAAANSTLMITTTANLLPAPQRRSPRAPYLPWATATTLAGLLAMYFAGRQKFALLEGRAGYATLALLVITAGGLVGCATMSTASTTPTPKGAATITVTATSGADVRPMVINVNVN